MYCSFNPFPSFLAIAILFSQSSVTSFTSCNLPIAITRTCIAYSSPKTSPLEDEPWKRDSSYWDLLQEASKDPATFDKFIEESIARKKLDKAHMDRKLDVSPENKPEKKTKYVPIEEWDSQLKDSMTAEERLQWECQRGGNRIRQNDILQHHLKSFWVANILLNSCGEKLLLYFKSIY